MDNKSRSVLFVCSANVDRSKTAEDYFSAIYPNLEFRSCGTNKSICFQEGSNYLDEEDLEWADVIYVMERKHLKAIKSFSKLKLSNKIEILNIPDHFKYNDPKLIEVLEGKVSL
tara:strand:- start:51 stop:392 length:342 start_codon:yes stop_codon:yes gene_type:complete